MSRKPGHVLKFSSLLGVELRDVGGKGHRRLLKDCQRLVFCLAYYRTKYLRKYNCAARSFPEIKPHFIKALRELYRLPWTRFELLR
ncbi:hypothetical protein EIP91_010677 [Steccherinum ochraceum]|uniref:Uncharacterized protein n=1 Tax=Steccherinum ochraceum TaxID=92696 RepID=A0A4R0R0D5_9APHY|nr:hypothetical protein EIP91_010677 [Steccherinum ochraceum]